MIKLKSKEDNIFILENHGLIICGQDLNQVRKLNDEVRKRLNQLEARTFFSNDKKPHEKIDLEGTGYKFCKERFINSLAFNQQLIQRLSQGALLPDFLVFLGPNLKVISPTDKNLLSTLKKLSKGPLPFNSCIILVNKGVIIRNDALKGTLEIIRYACNLISLIPDHADLKYLNESEASALLDWESEHYRQSQNKSKL